MTIAPSIICANYLHLQDELNKLSSNGIKMLHIDIMDGVFVPQITIGSEFTAFCKKGSDFILDIHLMTIHPEKHIEAFANAGANIITFHIEATSDPYQVAKLIRSFGCKAGIAIKPKTDISCAVDLLDKDIIDNILICTVEPGAYGQKFIPECLNKVKQVSKLITEKELNNKITIEVDGGINNTTYKQCKDAGANIFVVGAYIFKNPNLTISESIASLNN